jgi:putative glutamine amidotransferase
MPNLATWIRPCDDKWFNPIFARHPDLRVWNAASESVGLNNMDGLLLSGGPDVSREFVKQSVPDPSLIRDATPDRDRWEFSAVEAALARGLPILAICKGLQLFNVALGGTLRLDIAGHNLPEMKDADVQRLRTETSAAHRFEKVNSSHHQAVDRLGEGFAVEAWSDNDDIVEQVRLRNYPFAIGVQYHPERGTIYDALFDDFFAHCRASVSAQSG